MHAPITFHEEGKLLAWMVRMIRGDTFFSRQGQRVNFLCVCVEDAEYTGGGPGSPAKEIGFISYREKIIVIIN